MFTYDLQVYCWPPLLIIMTSGMFILRRYGLRCDNLRQVSRLSQSNPAGMAATYSFALWAWPKFLGNSSAPTHLIKNWSTGNASGITCSMEMTYYGRAEVSHLVCGRWNVFPSCYDCTWISIWSTKSSPIDAALCGEWPLVEDCTDNMTSMWRHASVEVR